MFFLFIKITDIDLSKYAFEWLALGALQEYFLYSSSAENPCLVDGAVASATVTGIAIATGALVRMCFPSELRDFPLFEAAKAASSLFPTYVAYQAVDRIARFNPAMRKISPEIFSMTYSIFLGMKSAMRRASVMSLLAASTIFAWKIATSQHNVSEYDVFLNKLVTIFEPICITTLTTGIIRSAIWMAEMIRNRPPPVTTEEKIYRLGEKYWVCSYIINGRVN